MGLKLIVPCVNSIHHSKKKDGIISKLISGCVCIAYVTACSQQVCCKLSTDLLQVDCQKLLSTGLLQVVSSLQMTSCNKPDFNRLSVATGVMTTQPVVIY